MPLISAANISLRRETWKIHPLKRQNLPAQKIRLQKWRIVTCQALFWSVRQLTTRNQRKIQQRLRLTEKSNGLMSIMLHLSMLSSRNRWPLTRGVRHRQPFLSNLMNQINIVNCLLWFMYQGENQVVPKTVIVIFRHAAHYKIRTLSFHQSALLYLTCAVDHL